MPLPHRDPAITAYVRHVVIGLDNAEPTKVAARLGVSGAWVVNVRDGHRGVGLDALRKIAAAHFDGSLDRLEQAARDWAAEHPEVLGAPDPNTSPKPKVPRLPRSRGPGALARDPSSGSLPLDNLRAARERLLERGYPRDAINEALLSPAVQDSSDVLLVFDLAERQLIASGYAAQMHNLLRRGQEVATRNVRARTSSRQSPSEKPAGPGKPTTSPPPEIAGEAPPASGDAASGDPAPRGGGSRAAAASGDEPARDGAAAGRRRRGDGSAPPGSTQARQGRAPRKKRP